MQRNEDLEFILTFQNLDVDLLPPGSVRVKKTKKIDPLKNGFFVINYHHWTGLWGFGPFLASLGHQGGLGGLCGVKGGLQKPNFPISAWDYFLPWDAFFWT